MKILLDAGHALTGAVGAHGNGFKEEVEARVIVSLLDQKLRAMGHKTVLCSCDNEKDANKQLQRIVAVANAHKDADLFVSIHFNAFAKESANGTETYSYSKSGIGHEYATKINNELVKLGFTNRGKKEAGYYVLRNTSCPAVLVETCFITNVNDMKKYNPHKVSDAIIKAITGQTVSVPQPEKIKYSVIAGTYNVKKNAEDMKKALEDKGFEAFIKTVKE